VTGSEFHKAPEICYSLYPYSGEKADMFSLGVVLFAMNMRTFPFERVKDVIYSRKYKHFLEGNLERFWPTETSTSPEFKKLVMKMLVKDPSKRISLDDVIGDDWTIIDELPSKEDIEIEIARCSRIVKGQELAWVQ